MQLTEYHKQRNEQRLQANMEQRHLSREEMEEHALRVIRRAEDKIYQRVLENGPFPGMTIVQSMVEIERRVHTGSGSGRTFHSVTIQKMSKAMSLSNETRMNKKVKYEP